MSDTIYYALECVTERGQGITTKEFAGVFGSLEEARAACPFNDKGYTWDELGYLTVELSAVRWQYWATFPLRIGECFDVEWAYRDE